MSDVPPLDRILRGEAPTYDALVNYTQEPKHEARDIASCAEGNRVRTRVELHRCRGRRNPGAILQ